MRVKDRLYLSGAAIALAAVLAAAPAELRAQTAVAIDNDDIGGVVTGANGPEAGVWVIAETTDLPTRYAKIVVTDDQGRYVVPDLPKANYKVWVRGYGLVDSPKVDGEPGKHLDLRRWPAPSAAAAAHYYPAIYWYSMLKIPDESEFGSKDNDIPAKITQHDWLTVMKNRACIGCHQLGQQATRTIPAAFGDLGRGGLAPRQVRPGRRAHDQPARRLARRRAVQVFRRLDRSHRQGRAAARQAAAAARRRAQRRHHHLGLGQREEIPARPDLGRPALSDGQRRRQALRLAGIRHRRVADPRSQDPHGHQFQRPGARPEHAAVLGPGHAAAEKPVTPSAYWGDKAIWDTRANNHNMMFDKKGRVWLAASVRGRDNPAFCKEGSDHPSAKLFPLRRKSRQLAVLDPKTMKYTFVDTCFDTHHLQFGYDANDTLWTSGGGPVVGWLNMKMFDETGDAAKAQGWTPLVLDTNGNGKRDATPSPRTRSTPPRTSASRPASTR